MVCDTTTETSNLKDKRQAAKFLGCSRGAVERLMRSGLPYVKVGKLVRFKPGDLADFVEQRRIVAGRG
jgi:excisionase family DNA binding protein